MIRAGTSRWAIAAAVMALAVGGLAFASPASAGPKSNKPAVVTVNAVPTDQSVTVTYTINRAHKAIASQTCTLDGNSTPCDTTANSATGKPVKTTYAVTIDSLANGEHTFAVSFRLADGNGGSNSATFTINYTPPNRPPMAVDDVVETYENTPVTFNVLDNDTDADGDFISLASYTLSTIGGRLDSIGGPLIKYTPNTGFAGTDTFTYRARDEVSGSNTATVTITVLRDPYPASRVLCQSEPEPGTFTLGGPTTIDDWTCTLPVASQKVTDVFGACLVNDGGVGRTSGDSLSIYCRI